MKQSYMYIDVERVKRNDGVKNTYIDVERFKRAHGFLSLFELLILTINVPCQKSLEYVDLPLVSMIFMSKQYKVIDTSHLLLEKVKLFY